MRPERAAARVRRPATRIQRPAAPSQRPAAPSQRPAARNPRPGSGSAAAGLLAGTGLILIAVTTALAAACADRPEVCVTISPQLPAVRCCK